MAPHRVIGLLLIAVGGALLLVVTTEVGGEIVVGLLGVGFLVAYAMTRTYGLLIPGAILTGLGSGIAIAAWGGPSESVVLGLGVGFLAIAVVDGLLGTTGPGWWWPFIPGGVLTFVGSSTITGLRDVHRYLVPTVLIVLGIVLVARRTPRQPDTASTADNGAEPARSSGPPPQQGASPPA